MRTRTADPTRALKGVLAFSVPLFCFTGQYSTQREFLSALKGFLAFRRPAALKGPTALRGPTALSASLTYSVAVLHIGSRPGAHSLAFRFAFQGFTTLIGPNARRGPTAFRGLTDFNAWLIH